MSNNHGKPPVPSKEKNPLQGIGIPKVEFYHLEDRVRELRCVYGMSDENIAKSLNENELAGEKYKISTMAVLRWRRKNIKDGDRDLRRSPEEVINIYGHTLDMLSSIDDQLEILESYIEKLHNDVKSTDDVLKYGKDMKDFMMTYEKLSAKKQQLLNTIAGIQKEVYSWQAANEVTAIVMEEAEKIDKNLWMNITKRLRENPKYVELLNKIKPDDKK